MHELSIAQAVVEVASRHAAGRQIRSVRLKVGHLRQVVPSALEFAFELVSAGTALEGAELAMEAVPARGRCRACGSETVMKGFPLQCAGCGALDLQIVAGDELLVDSLEVESDAAAATTTGG